MKVKLLQKYMYVKPYKVTASKLVGVGIIEATPSHMWNLGR